MSTLIVCLPHARGGVSLPQSLLQYQAVSSPRSWGCFPRSMWSSARCWSLPHARGGVSQAAYEHQKEFASSPRSWGCFNCLPVRLDYPGVFPTLVGVFLRSMRASSASCRLPHARGGVSEFLMDMGIRPSSSPRSWGCFHVMGWGSAIGGVFPTLVGVFLRKRSKFSLSHCLPHARGGVSAERSVRTQQQVSSPRSWGCFGTKKAPCDCSQVFPTLVGVFPCGAFRLYADASLPHARGGVSGLVRL